MSGEIRVGGSWRPVAGGEVFLGGSWRSLIRGEAYKGAAWKPLVSFASTLTLSVDPSPAITGVRPVTASTRTVSISMTATPTGGFGPYTYLYQTLSYSGSAPVIASATSATTAISKSVPSGASYTDSFRVTVTDALGVAASVNFTITFFNEPGDGLGGHQ